MEFFVHNSNISSVTWLFFATIFFIYLPCLHDRFRHREYYILLALWLSAFKIVLCLYYMHIFPFSLCLNIFTFTCCSFINFLTTTFSMLASFIRNIIIIIFLLMMNNLLLNPRSMTAPLGRDWFCQKSCFLLDHIAFFLVCWDSS